MNPFERIRQIEEKINKYRQDFIKAVNFQITEVFFYSLEGEEKSHQHAMDELETALTLLWRFDRKLQEAKSLEALLETLDKSSTGSTSK